MFLAHAKFSKMHVRSCYKCAKPYPTLAEAACEQREYHYENEEGQIIAIYCPDYVEGINLPGWHFHLDVYKRQALTGIVQLPVAWSYA